MEDATQETQQTQETQGTQETLAAQLEEERKSKAAAEASLAEKDDRIASLESSLSEAKQGSEAVAAELARVKEANIQAVSKYLDVVRSANPTIPQDIIAGDTIEDIDASLAKAITIAESVKSSLEAQAKETKVPAGAPTRTEISVEGLTPREKIAAGIQQKGGTS
jgi:chromosome segregation ATPase